MNRRDLEQLSAYLDGELKPSEVAKIEKRLKLDPKLESALDDLSATRALLRRLPRRKAPRNFTLTRKMAGQNPPLPRTYPLFRLATMVATLLFFFSVGINSFSSQVASQQIGFGIGGSGGGGGASETELFAAEEPAAPPPAAAAATEEPATEPDIYASGPATEEPPLDSADQPVDDLSLKTAEAENAVEAEQVRVAQEAPPIVSSAWQIGLAIVAILGALLMVLMRQLSARRWKQ